MVDSGPILGKDTPFSSWQSNAKAYLRRKEVFACCTASTKEEKDKLDIVAIEKCAGILWGMLSEDVKPLVKDHEDDPSALWAALQMLFAPKKAGARFRAYKELTSIRLKDDESLLGLTGRVSKAMKSLKCRTRRIPSSRK